jgi:hypothetical protein
MYVPSNISTYLHLHQQLYAQNENISEGNNALNSFLEKSNRDDGTVGKQNMKTIPTKYHALIARH